jgi:DNA polymerase-3 subunit epsilon
VAIVLLQDGRVVDQSLMNAGVRIPSFITQLTGISNAMVAAATPPRPR